MSSEPYFLVEDLPAPGLFELGGAEGRHAATVRRLRPGAELVLTDGNGSWARGTVTAAGRGELTLRVGPGQRETPPAIRVVLVQALPKGERSELAVDLATEAGVDAIVPWQASRCVARWSGEKAHRGAERWRSIAREAAKQSRRVWVPTVHDLADTGDVAALIGLAAGALVLHEAEAAPIRLAELPESGDVVLIVGPEGGIAPDELAAFTAAGAHPVRLGREVLRTSLAGAVAVGALGVLTGRWD